MSDYTCICVGWLGWNGGYQPGAHHPNCNQATRDAAREEHEHKNGGGNLWTTFVRDFHQKYDQPIAVIPGRPTVDIEIFRQTLLRQEYRELNDAIERGDLEQIFGEILDMIYVLIGTALVYGLPLHQGMIAVHNANMRKQRAMGDSNTTKPIKPPGWVPPNLREILKANGWKGDKFDV